jgi:hypothetical protein
MAPPLANRSQQVPAWYCESLSLRTTRKRDPLGIFVVAGAGAKTRPPPRGPDPLRKFCEKLAGYGSGPEGLLGQGPIWLNGGF